MRKTIYTLFPFKSTSWYVLLALFTFIVYLTFVEYTPMPLGWDNMGYYVYLAELFGDGDLFIEDLSYYEGIMETYKNTSTLYQFIPIERETGGLITKYTMGWAVLNAPFMYIGHLWAGWSDYPQDGFSYPYRIASIISSLFYTLLGLLLMRKLLLKFFSEKLTIILLIVLVLGTNYLHMNTSSTGLSHIYLFTLYASLLLLTIKFHANKTIKYAIFIGLNLGLLMLVRPTEILACLIPLLYGVTTIQEFKTRFLDFFKLKYYRTSLLFIVLVGSLQLFYWKYTTGSFFYYSYAHHGEGLDFNKPYILEVLFSFRKGWLIYTPVMALIVFGFVQVYKKQKALFWGLFAFTILNLYVVSCWTIWWYASSFSQRALEHSYPIYIFLIGFALYELSRNKKIIAGTFIALCIGLNLFQTWQVRHHIIHLSNMTKNYYLSVFGQTTDVTEEQKKLLLINRDLATFDNIEDYSLIKTITPNYDLPMVLNAENMQTPLIEIPFESLTEKDHLWLRASATIELLEEPSKYTEAPFAVHLCVSMQHKRRTYYWRNTPLYNADKKIITLTKDYLTPDLRDLGDEIGVRVWLQYGASVVVKDISFDIYEPKK